MSDFPYAERFTVNRTLPEEGRDRAEGGNDIASPIRRLRSTGLRCP